MRRAKRRSAARHSQGERRVSARADRLARRCSQRDSAAARPVAQLARSQPGGPSPTTFAGPAPVRHRPGRGATTIVPGCTAGTTCRSVPRREARDTGQLVTVARSERALEHPQRDLTRRRRRHRHLRTSWCTSTVTESRLRAARDRSSATVVSSRGSRRLTGVRLSTSATNSGRLCPDRSRRRARAATCGSTTSGTAAASLPSAVLDDLDPRRVGMPDARCSIAVGAARHWSDAPGQAFAFRIVCPRVRRRARRQRDRRAARRGARRRGLTTSLAIVPGRVQVGGGARPFRPATGPTSYKARPRRLRFNTNAPLLSGAFVLHVGGARRCAQPMRGTGGGWSL